MSEKVKKIYVQGKDGVSPSDTYVIVDDESLERLIAKPIEEFAGEGVATVSEGDGISVDNTDPKNPIVAVSPTLAIFESARTVNDISDPEALSADFVNRTLVDDTGVSVVGWNTCQLKDLADVNSANWNTRLLQDAIGAQSIDWGARQLKTAAGVVSLDWDNDVLQKSISGTHAEILALQTGK
jgi:hypothetical protein